MKWATEVMRRYRSLPAARSTLVWAGFAGMLALMGVLAVDAGIAMRKVEATGTQLRRAARERNRLLGDLRGFYFRSSTLIRDYLLEDRTEGLAGELRRMRPDVLKALEELKPGAPPEEAAELELLRERTNQYWDALEPLFEGRTAAARLEAGSFVRKTVLPLRDELVRLVQQVNEMDARNLDASEREYRDLEAGLRDRIARISTAVLCIGGLLALLVGIRIGSLEREAARRLADIAEARRSLRLLQGRMVAAQEEERKRIARELHDDVGQDLGATLRDLDRLKAAAGSHGEQFAEVRKTVEQVVGKVRDIALMLRPSMLDELGLAPALRWQAREVTRRTGLSVRVDAEAVEDVVPDAHGTCVYRVVQEALNNCARHAQASEARVAVKRSRGGLEISIADDGKGFDAAREKGLGLLGMAERVEQLGGSLSIDSHPGAGTIVRAFLPLDGEAKGLEA